MRARIENKRTRCKSHGQLNMLRANNCSPMFYSISLTPDSNRPGMKLFTSKPPQGPNPGVNRELMADAHSCDLDGEIHHATL